MVHKMLIGPFVHVNFSQLNYLIQAAKIVKADQGNTFMLYSPVISTHHDFHAHVNMLKFQKYCQKNGINDNALVLHAPFMINLANPVDERVWHYSIHFLKKQLIYCDRIGFKYLVLHPGSHLKGTLEEGLNRLIWALNRLKLNQYNAQIVLETMSGKGHEIGTRFEDFAYILKNLDYPNKVGICLDTCHMNDAGYDLSNWNQIKKQMKQSFDLNKVMVIHLNDSMNDMGSHKDRHENIGYGTIGFENLVKIAWDEDFINVPKILETPYYTNDHSPYKAEIKSIRNKHFINFKKLIS